MPLFSDAALQKLEPFFTRRRKEWDNDPASFWAVWWNPSLSLKPSEQYHGKLYIRVAMVSMLHGCLYVGVSSCIGLILGGLIVPQFWPMIRDPKYHASLIGFLAREGFYQLLFLPLVSLSFVFASEWPRYFFWNRRAKRLQNEGVVSVSLNAMVEPPEDDGTCWPPPPRRAV
jgi:hypothetical protein